MDIKFLFSKNKLIGSYIIRLCSYWVNNIGFTFDNTPSHVAILIDDIYVIESVMSDGVRIIPYNKWLERNILISKIEADNFKECPKDLMFEMWGKSYDNKGLFYFAICVLKNKLFNTPLPKTNIFEQEDRFFCTEFASRIYDGDTGSMRTPLQLMKIIQDGQI